MISQLEEALTLEAARLTGTRRPISKRIFILDRGVEKKVKGLAVCELDICTRERQRVGPHVGDRLGPKQ